MKSMVNKGFTLIELVVVITILGILAAFAVPKFVALDSTARTSTIEGLAGSVKSAAALARSMAMANSTPLGPVNMEGALVTLLNNYPDGSLTGIAAALNANITAGTGDYTFTPGAGAAAAVWTKNGAPIPATCSVAYTPAVAGFEPTVAIQTAGC
jgi:MSHA pilin protein MshA